MYPVFLPNKRKLIPAMLQFYTYIFSLFYPVILHFRKNLFIYLVCIYMGLRHTHAMVHIRKRTVCESQFSLFATQVSGIEFRASDLATGPSTYWTILPAPLFILKCCFRSTNFRAVIPCQVLLRSCLICQVFKKTALTLMIRKTSCRGLSQ